MNLGHDTRYGCIWLLNLSDLKVLREKLLCFHEFKSWYICRIIIQNSNCRQTNSNYFVMIIWQVCNIVKYNDYVVVFKLATRNRNHYYLTLPWIHINHEGRRSSQYNTWRTIYFVLFVMVFYSYNAFSHCYL